MTAESTAARLGAVPPVAAAPRRGNIDALPSLSDLDLVAMAGGRSYGRSGYVERGFQHGKRFYRDLVRRVGFDRDERVLDIGCGFGRWSVFLAEVNREVAGIDPMRGRLAIARNLGEQLSFDNAGFVAGTSGALPFASDSFDAAWCFSALHFVDRDRTLEELRRVLRPGGRLFVGLYFGVGRMIALLCHSWREGGWDHPDFRFAARALAQGSAASGPPNFGTGEDLAGIMRRSGFRVDRQIDIDGGPVGLLRPGEAELFADPRALVDRFHSSPEFRDRLLADYPRLTRARDYNLSFLAAAA